MENVKPTSSAEIVIEATSALPSSSLASKASKFVSSSSIVPSFQNENDRKGKMIQYEEAASGPSSLIEASEYEPQVFATSFTSSSSSDYDETSALESQVVVASSAPSSVNSKPKQVHFPTPFVQVSIFSLSLLFCTIDTRYKNTYFHISISLFVLTSQL